MKRAPVCLLLALALGAGCSGERDPKSLLGPTGRGTIVVDARLIVGFPFPRVGLTTTQTPNRPWDDDAAALAGARVIITWRASADVVDTAFYGQTPFPAVYGFDHSSGDYGVRPRTTYTLRVESADGRVVTAQTTTPDTFFVSQWVLLDQATLAVRRQLAAPPAWLNGVPDTIFRENQLTYQDGIVEARFPRGSALAFQMALLNLESDSPLLIDADFLSEADKASLNRESSSPPIDAPDGYARLPWLAVWFEGRHRFLVYSIDRNWYDIARSVRFNGPTSIGFGSNAGDDFQRPIFHVEGGIGLFGSAAMDETGFTVLPRP